MGTLLTILLPTLIVGYALYLILRIKKRGSCQGCANCPYAQGCTKRPKEPTDHA